MKTLKGIEYTIVDDKQETHKQFLTLKEIEQGKINYMHFAMQMWRITKRKLIF
jgi:hypothetical protein